MVVVTAKLQRSVTGYKVGRNCAPSIFYSNDKAAIRQGASRGLMALIINRQLFGKKRNLYIAAFIWSVGSANEMEQRRRGTIDGLLSPAQERVGGGKAGGWG